MIPIPVGDMVIYAGPEFGSEAPEHRLRLREAVREIVLQKSVAASTDSIFDLSAPPRIDGWAISISHCLKLGGFVAVQTGELTAIEIGLDFELTGRVTKEIARRVAAFPNEPAILLQIEAAEMPPALFWAAKEAAIKAFGNRDPLLAPHFGVIRILEMDLEEFSFKASYGDVTAEGILFGVAEGEYVSVLDSESEIVGAIVEVPQLSKS